MKPNSATGLLLLVLSALMLTGCGGSLGNPKLKVNLPDDCARLQSPVPVPRISADGDMRSLAAESLAALRASNGRLAQSRDCEAKVREHYATFE